MIMITVQYNRFLCVIFRLFHFYWMNQSLLSELFLKVKFWTFQTFVIFQFLDERWKIPKTAFETILKPQETTYALVYERILVMETIPPMRTISGTWRAGEKEKEIWNKRNFELNANRNLCRPVLFKNIIY
jgi:hypothetical protein